MKVILAILFGGWLLGLAGCDNPMGHGVGPHEEGGRRQSPVTVHRVPAEDGSVCLCQCGCEGEACEIVRDDATGMEVECQEY